MPVGGSLWSGHRHGAGLTADHMVSSSVSSLTAPGIQGELTTDVYFLFMSSPLDPRQRRNGSDVMFAPQRLSPIGRSLSISYNLGHVIEEN